MNVFITCLITSLNPADLIQILHKFGIISNPQCKFIPYIRYKNKRLKNELISLRYSLNIR